MRIRGALLIALSPLAVNAQAPAHRNILSFQPLSLADAVFAAEYERAISRSVSLGAGGTHWSTGNGQYDSRYNSADLKVRYYIEGEVLRGFSLGGSVGYAKVTPVDAATLKSASCASFGVLLEYQWLMGQRRNFALAAGAGAKRLITLTRSDFGISITDIVQAYPTLRVSVGRAF